MNLQVVAEGLKKKTNSHFFREQQCDVAQDFLFSEPLINFGEFSGVGDDGEITNNKNRQELTIIASNFIKKGRYNSA